MLFSPSIKNLNDLFLHQLKDIYYTEKKIVKTLPDLADKATDSNLKNGFQTHLTETKDQISKLERAFDILGEKAEGEKCDAIEGILKEGDHLVKDCEEGATRDSALIAAAQKVEHYEIATYGALCHMANLLGQTEVADILHSILEQEKSTDEKLTSMSTSVEKMAVKKAA